MLATDILEHFLSRASWVNRSATVDRVIIGDQTLDADRCCVSWMPSTRALQEMVRRGIRLMICHEPTFWNHHDHTSEDDPHLLAKRDFILSHALTIIRNHDCWDRWPQVGIPWAWAQHLGLGSRPVCEGGSGYQHRYDVAPLRVRELAARIGDRCAEFGEPAVQVTGDPERLVGRIGIGTGCACDIRTFIAMGCDCSIVCDDGTCYWSEIQRARDIGHPVIRANHGTSEEAGMRTLTQYINANLPLRAEYLPHGSIFRLSR